jgi:hypothetical protein
MDATSSKRFKTAMEQMETSDFSGRWTETKPIDAAFETLRESVRQLSGMLTSGRRDLKANGLQLPSFRRAPAGCAR